MTIVQIWKLRSGVSRAQGIESIQKCVVHGSDYERAIDAAHFVEELCIRNDQCASSAAANPVGLKLTLNNPIGNKDYAQFRQCFHFNTVTRPVTTRLKLFRASITEKKKSITQATVQHNSLLILARNADEVIDTIAAEYPKCALWDIKIKEIEGPFSTGQIIMDIGIRVISTITDPLLTDF